MAKSLQEIEQFIKNNSIRGWLSAREGALLYNLSKKCPAGKAIVEIGSWEGRSTIYLSNGSKSGGSARIFAIDPHTGPGMSAKNIHTFDTFIKNVTHGGVIDLVTPIVKYSQNAVDDVNTPVGLLFIDGDHSYETVKIDFEKWFPKVINGGVVAFHDSIKYDGPKRLLAEIVPKSRIFRKAGVVDSIFFITRSKNNSVFDRIRNRYILFLRDIIEYGASMNRSRFFSKKLRSFYKSVLSFIQGNKFN